jgi:hypothetical protein
MQLRTYTGLWGVEKRLYKIYDITLPYPVSIKQLGIFLVTATTWWFSLSLLSVPFATPWHTFWIVPPFAITWLVNQPVAEGKTLTDFALSNFKFYTKSRNYTDMAPAPKKPEKSAIRASYWTHSLRQNI